MWVRIPPDNIEAPQGAIFICGALIMSAEDDDFKLRDKMAISIIHSLMVNAKVNSMWFVDNREEGDRFDKEVERFAITAYKIADAIRKARLISFK